MKAITTVLAGLAVATALSGCATQQQQAQTNTHLQVMQNQLSMLNQANAEQLKKLPTPIAGLDVCLLAGQPYSEGAIAAGRVCAPSALRVVGQPRKLSWQSMSAFHGD